MYSTGTGGRETTIDSGDALSLVAHDMRGSLAAIKGFAMTLRAKRHMLTSEQHDTFLSRIVDQADELIAFTDDVLDIARAEGGRLVLVREPCDFGALAAAALATARVRHPDHRFDVRAPGAYVVDAEPRRISQVVLNLLENAARHAPPGSEIVVEIGRTQRGDGADVFVRVHDQGPGIPADARPFLFEKFSRACRTSTGLGLYLCRLIVEAHGGRIWAIAGGPGATLTFVLPSAEPEPRVR